MTNPTIDKDGDKFWFNADGQQHREDGPAGMYASGYKEWFVNGHLHREDGPAIEHTVGNESFYLYGCGLSQSQYAVYQKSFHNILSI